MFPYDWSVQVMVFYLIKKKGIVYIDWGRMLLQQFHRGMRRDKSGSSVYMLLVLFQTLLTPSPLTEHMLLCLRVVAPDDTSCRRWWHLAAWAGQSCNQQRICSILLHHCPLINSPYASQRHISETSAGTLYCWQNGVPGHVAAANQSWLNCNTSMQITWIPLRSKISY